ncbi:MAG: CPBP family intramembrane metalloprotease, partial [Desulfobacterales bacterium]|nr:CPBP family intramembrane metalloprotease [Desulfobacterales bacterium]
EKYLLFLNKSPLLTLITLGIFVGPAEDILFLGIIQNTLTARIGWIAVLVYIIIFTLFHYINVLSNAESKKEFFGMLPVRLMISLIMSIAFYQTKSLIYSLVIHNFFDTLNYLALLKVEKDKKKNYSINNRLNNY